MSVKDVYVLAEFSGKEVWYVTDYSVGQGQIAVSQAIEDARKLDKHEAERVAEHFGMKSIKLSD